MKNDIVELENKIREYINSPRKQNFLVKDTAYWYMLCSCLDAIGDTELAIDAFLCASSEQSHGELYLLIYGILQSLFLQQDAVKNLSESLNIDYQINPIINEIREIRNDSIGHPTKRGGGKGKSYSFISRATMSTTGFQLMTMYPDSKPDNFQDINIPNLISDQREKLSEVLHEILKSLEEEEMKHKDQFKEEKIIDIFPSSLRYHLSKISEATFGSTPPELGLINLEIIERILEDFLNILEKRGLSGAYIGVDHTSELLQYPLQQLRLYFESPHESKLNNQDAYIFNTFISSQIDELKSMATEIDDAYESS